MEDIIGNINYEIENPQAITKAIERVNQSPFYKAIEDYAKNISPAGVKEPNALFYDKDLLGFRRARERFLNVDFWVLRRMADKGVIIPAIINTRLEQIAPFTRAYEENEESQQGFIIRKRDRSEVKRKDQKEIKELEQFVVNAGYTSRNYPGPGKDLLDEREDKFAGFANKFIRDALVIDQQCIELQKNKRGELVAFMMIDGATIRKTDPEHGYEGDKSIKYIQLYRGRVEHTFKKDDMIFSYKNRRSNIESFGYGSSPLEQMMDIITAILFATQYNKEQFSSSSMVQGFFALKGDVDEETLREMQRQWAANFRGLKGAWKTPFFASPDGVDFKKFSGTNKEMEFSRYLDFLLMIASAVYNISIDEMGIRLQKTTQTMNENVAPRIEYSKDRGMRGLLRYFEDTMNDILIYHPLGKKYELKFVGLFREDKRLAMELQEKEQENYGSINATRLKKGWPPILDKDGLPAYWAELPIKILNNSLLLQKMIQEHSPETPEDPLAALLGGLEKKRKEENEIPEETSKKEEIGEKETSTKEMTKSILNKSKKKKEIKSDVGMLKSLYYKLSKLFKTKIKFKKSKVPIKKNNSKKKIKFIMKSK